MQEVGPQSLEVTTSECSYRRNRRDLIRLPNSSDHDHVDTSDQDETTTVDQLDEPRRSTRSSQPPERFDPSWIPRGQ